VDLGGGLVVGALMAVNAFGDVVDPENGVIIAGVRSRDGSEMPGALNVLRSIPGKVAMRVAGLSHTVIGIVATNAKLDKEETNKVAQMAHDGLARVIRPAHTMFDGDTIFALATGRKSADVNLVGAYAAEVTAQAIVRGVQAAQEMSG
jgi:L-aminopeptidase/D-esterase-like protein